MALVIQSYSPQLWKKVKEKLKKMQPLLAFGITDEIQSFTFLHDVHIVHPGELKRDNLELPEGLRCVLLSQGNAIAFADFYYTPKRRLKFSHTTTGPQVAAFTAAIALLEEEYAAVPGNWTATVIKVPIRGSWFLLLQCRQQNRYYRYENNQLERLSKKELKANLKNDL
ncbi:hypothetical protein ECE50_008580 [Chitinophaga sp. Mgbs1]|uniref:Uncharacterized protein n=1 Tax=Chitinophaga solisilvae TaxID=1233460 RepID=A0A9Q5D5P7_9BACT|nr:hypothetical protein [Chitinophaga solisilvae]